MQRLIVSPNQRTLCRESGETFFWLGDTAWELFHRLDPQETDYFLKRRAAQGFTVIQAVMLAELEGLATGNWHGDKCLLDGNPARPNPPYFDHVDTVMEQAGALGLYMAVLPTWGMYVGDKTWPKDTPVFTPQNAATYGQFLGERYGDNPGVVWVLGGDRGCAATETLAIWRAMAAGLREGGARQLITFHPPGGWSSSSFIHEEDWLDFNMIQSSHFRLSQENWKLVASDYALNPIKPTLEAEPCYEEMPVGFKPANNIYFNAYEVRKAAYWAVLAGSFGFTYGCQAVWQMWTPDREPACGRVLRPWKESLELEGAGQMKFIRRLAEIRSFNDLQPAQNLLIAEWPCDIGSSNHVQIATIARPDRNGREATVAERHSEDVSSIVAYSPTLPLCVQIDTSRITAESLRVWAVNPRNGYTTDFGVMENVGRVKLQDIDVGPDVVYIIDNTDVWPSIPSPTIMD